MYHESILSIHFPAIINQQSMLLISEAHNQFKRSLLVVNPENVESSPQELLVKVRASMIGNERLRGTKISLST
jgi:hypothetical protein